MEFEQRMATAESPEMVAMINVSNLHTVVSYPPGAHPALNRMLYTITKQDRRDQNRQARLFCRVRKLNFP